MITNPTRQRSLRGHMPARPPLRTIPADHALLAGRLTPRDRWIIAMLHEHRVLTTHQITMTAFPSPRSARLRLRELYTWGVIDRFQPFVTVGTAPMHYVLAPLGAAVLAAEHGIDIARLGYRRHHAMSIAHSLRLAHTVGVAEWFATLIAHAHHHPNRHTALGAWWSEARCHRHFGDLVRPDAYGRWTHTDTVIEFFLEYDCATEPLAKLAHKLTGYAALAGSTGITTPLLVWLPTAHRETSARQALREAARRLDNPACVPIATAAADLLDPRSGDPSPADPVWLPLHTTRAGRRELHRLLDDWPQVTPPAADNDTAAPETSATLAPPAPMPPAPSHNQPSR